MNFHCTKAIMTILIFLPSPPIWLLNRLRQINPLRATAPSKRVQTV